MSDLVNDDKGTGTAVNDVVQVNPRNVASDADVARLAELERRIERALVYLDETASLNHSPTIRHAARILRGDADA
jgi:hypothetical protein